LMFLRSSGGFGCTDLTTGVPTDAPTDVPTDAPTDDRCACRWA
jgi:hypothetical protein